MKMGTKEYKRLEAYVNVGYETIGIISVLISALLASAGQILYKVGVDGNNWIAIIIALGIYGLSTVFYLYGLKTTPISVAYPLIATSYVIVTLAATKIFNEPLTSSKIAGILLILAGVTLIAR